MTFTEDWYRPSSLAILEKTFHESRGLDGRIVEVGCWEGRSTVQLANAAYPAVIHAVDTWAGSPGEISADLAAERDVYARFVENVEALTLGNVIPYRMDWRQFFVEHPGPIRFLHIDATHTYDEVRANIEAALPHVVPGGIVCGDDAHHEPVITAAIDVLVDVEQRASLWVWEKHGD